jgi:replication factor A1
VNAGDNVEIYHATAKPGRFGGIELGVGKGSSFCVPKSKPEPVIFEGTIIAGTGCIFIDNGTERYLIEGNFPHGAEMRITGILSGSRIIPEQVQPVELKPETLLLEIRGFVKEITP